MEIKRYNICSKKSYEKNGETKNFWLRCGTLSITEDKKKFIELNMFPNTPFYAFPVEEKKKEEPKSDGNTNYEKIERWDE